MRVRAKATGGTWALWIGAGALAAVIATIDWLACDPPPPRPLEIEITVEPLDASGGRL